MIRRTATNAGDKKSEAYISQQLRQRWPSDEYPFNIGDQCSTAVDVKIRDDSGQK